MENSEKKKRQRVNHRGKASQINREEARAAGHTNVTAGRKAGMTLPAGSVKAAAGAKKTRAIKADPRGFLARRAERLNTRGVKGTGNDD